MCEIVLNFFIIRKTVIITVCYTRIGINGISVIIGYSGYFLGIRETVTICIRLGRIGEIFLNLLVIRKTVTVGINVDVLYNRSEFVEGPFSVDCLLIKVVDIPGVCKCFVEEQDADVEIVPSADTVLVRVSEK